MSTLHSMYKIKGSTLKKIANAIRRQHGFSSELNPEEFPSYISDKTNPFWVTHFNDNSTDLEGTGVIFTPDSGLTPAIRGWHRYIYFKKSKFDIRSQFQLLIGSFAGISHAQMDDLLIQIKAGFAGHDLLVFQLGEQQNVGGHFRESI